MKKIIFLFLLSCISIFIFNISISRAQWVQANGPNGGTINTLSSNQNGIFAGTDGAGLLYSSNNGSNWISLDTNVFNALFVYSIGFLNNNIFIGTAGGVYRTTNFGVNWISVPEIPATCISMIVVNNNIFVGTEGGGIYLSTDFGINWSQINNGIPSFAFVHTLISKNNNIFAGTEDYNHVGQVYKTTDNGNLWSSVSAGLNVQSVLDICSAGAYLFAGCYPGIYMSSNDGLNWTQLMGNEWVSAITFKDNLIIAATGDGIYESSNNGGTWISTNNGLSNTSIQSLLVKDDNIYAGSFKSLNNSGVYITTDNGNNWNFSSSGIRNCYVNSMTVVNGTIFASDVYVGVFKSTDMGNSWAIKNNGISNCSLYSIFSRDSILFLGVSQNGVYVSTDNGQNWINKNSGMANNTRVNAFIADGNNIIAGTSGGAYLTSNNGNNWNINALSVNVNCLSSEGNKILAGCSDGVYLSTNHGLSWQNIGVNEYIYSILCKDSVVYAGTCLGIYISSNSGGSWQNIIFGDFYFITSLAAAGDYVLAGTAGGGTYLTVNNGLNWTHVNNGMLPLQVNSLLVSNDFVFAGTAGQSVWKRPLSEIIGIKNISSSIPKSFMLYQNCPNPFNPTTKIKFSLPKNSNVAIKIYDITGREVSTLINEKLNAGTYIVDWDASNFASGVYFYSLQTDNFTETKKLVLIK